MRTFKEFPCTVYEVTRNYKIRKVIVREPYNQHTSSIGRTNSTCVQAKDCHPTFAAAIAAAGKVVAQRIKSLDKYKEEALGHQASLKQQMADHINPPKKAMKCPPKP